MGRFVRGQVPHNKKYGEIACNSCGTLFKQRVATSKYCSHECYSRNLEGSIPWNKGTLGVMKPNKGSFKRGVSASPATQFKKGNIPHNWKGDEVGYSALHDWVVRKKGLPMTCEECGIEKEKSQQIHWANISGEYKRSVDDFKRLCVKCHRAFDGWYEKMNVARIENRNGKFYKGVV